jgi:hypothetical protein
MSRLGLSAYKMNSLKGAVIKKGLVEQFPVNLGKAFGGKVMLLALTKAGFKALKKRAVVRPDNVSAEHWWWQKAQKGYYDRRSYETVLEMRIGNSKSRADLGIKTKNGWVAIEVELGPGNAVANIENDLAAGFIRVVCCCKDRLVAKEVLRRLQAHRRYEKIKDKVEVKVLTELELVKELFGKNS